MEKKSCKKADFLMVGGSGGMLPQKILKIRCSEVHFGTLSSEIEQRKVVKKLIF